MGVPVVKEERRLRVDNVPMGRFTESFSQTAFPGHPYGRPVIGYQKVPPVLSEAEQYVWSDYDELVRAATKAELSHVYIWRVMSPLLGPGFVDPGVGDVDPMQVQKMAEKYFGGWQVAQPVLPLVRPAWRQSDGWDALPALGSPPGSSSSRASGAEGGPKHTLRMSLPAHPLYLEGYYRPSAASTDDPALSVLSELLSGSRSARLYKNLVVPGKVLSASASESFPGDKRACLLLLYGVPSDGSTSEQVAQLIHHELEEISARGVTTDELVPFRKATRAGLLEVLGNNSGMAKLLCRFEAQAGSWDGLLQESRNLEEVEAADVQRVAARLFRPANGVAGYLSESKAFPFSVPSFN
eukprot:jgi/Mesen1/3750/ME000204S03011